MKAKDLFAHLDRNFILPELSDNWSEIANIAHYTDNFKNTYMGLALDNADEIKHVYTAVFASKNTIEHLLKNNISNALLFTHHPMGWDITQNPVFQEITQAHLEELKARKISLYTLHVPLDRVSDFSTSVTLARALGANILDSFAEYHGSEVAVITQVQEKTIQELLSNFEKAIGHTAKLYPSIHPTE